MDPIVRDLSKWIPTLLETWRSGQKYSDGPSNRLLPQELRQISQSVRRLSQGLTGKRDMAGSRYMDDQRILGAYLLYYWPNSYAQARYALREISASGKIGSVLDLGGGPGPAAFAALDAGAKNAVIADRSENALELALKLAAGRGESIGTRSWKAANQPIPNGMFSLITMSHLINELWIGQADAVNRRAGLIERAFEHLEPGGRVLIIEPALRETSRALLQVRDKLMEKDIVAVYPCIFRGCCPALEKESDWCHSEFLWDAPVLMTDIAKASGLHKESLKMTAVAFMRKSEVPQNQDDSCVFRIVSEPLASKGRQRFMGCGIRGRIGLSLQTKHINECNNRFSRLKRGDLVRIQGLEEKGDGLALTPESKVEFA